MLNTIISPKIKNHENDPIFSLTESDISRPKSVSMVKITNWPPSNIGSGNKFIIPKLILMIAKNIKRDFNHF